MVKNYLVALIGLPFITPLYSGANNINPKGQKPNIVFILADNLGYGDIGCFGSKVHRTPNIDTMAKKGIRLTSFYSTSPVCTPSRASLMTGCYAQRVDMHWGEVDGHVLRPVSPKGLNTNEITIAGILNEKGYATACIGKWHLGDQPEFLPVNQGFDYFFGIPYSEDMYPRPNKNWPELPLLKNGRVIEAPTDLTTTTKRYVREALNFINENRDNPFFLYLPHNLPGSMGIPIVDDQFLGKSANGAWGDSVEEIDWSVGEILNTIKKMGLEENTLIIFTSDNGAPGTIGPNRPHIGSNEPFSGPGYTTMEGGVRMPVVAQWTGTIPKGISSNELTTMMDWLPTFAFLAGTEPPDDRIIDGKNIWPILSGDKNAKSPHELFYYYRERQLQAVREGNWKLHLPWENTRGGGKMKDITKPVLIDLNVDLKEDHDLGNIYPHVVKRLLQHAEKISKELGDPENKGEKVRPSGYVENPKPLLLK